MSKTSIIVAVTMLLAVGALVGTKVLQFKTLGAMKNVQPAVRVTFADTSAMHWDNIIRTVGSLETVDGIVVTAEEPGKIVKIAFNPGGHVTAGDLLVQQDVTIENAQLRSAQAAAELASSSLKRIQRLFRQNSASQADVDTARAESRKSAAMVDEVKARITKKSIRAPFDGKLGVRQVSLGQDLMAGDHVVVLQNLNPIQVNFLMPQRQLPKMSLGLPVRVSLDDRDFEVEGQITAINPTVDPVTRNVRIQAQIDNPDEQLLPGMYVTIGIELPTTKNVIAVPATAILYAPYGNTVFVIESGPNETHILRQQIIRTGINRGDYVEVLDGLKGDETVVSTGAFKLFNGQTVELDNSQAPHFSLTPTPNDS